MIKKIIGTKDGLKFSRLYRTSKKPLYINCSIHLCKNIRARNLNGRTELSHFDNDKYVTNINLEKIFKNNKDLFPTDLHSNSPLYK